MIEKVADTSLETLALYDAVIDVRSPAEFNEDHLPDAINLPVLSNEERAEVGTIYTRESRFRARRIGAAYVARNVAAHLQTALAEHRGSVFGGDPGAAQPSQKFFETSLYDRLRRLDPARPIAVEAESNAIGRIGIPKRLWTAMRAAPRIVIETGAGARARYLVRAYAHFIAEPGAIAASIGRLKSWHSKETIAEWLALAEASRHSIWSRLESTGSL